MLLLTAWGTSYGQTRGKWVVIDGKFVLLPLVDLRVITAKRLISDSLSHERLLVVHEQNKEITSMGGIIKLKDSELATAKQLLQKCDERYWATMDANSKLTKRNKRLKGWATAAKMMLAGGVVGSGLYVYKQILP